MTSTETLTRSEFMEQLATVPDATYSDGFTIDPEAAWDAYAADPQGWHADPYGEGNPIMAMVLTDGAWWVEA